MKQVTRFVFREGGGCWYQYHTVGRTCSTNLYIHWGWPMADTNFQEVNICS